MADTKVVRRNGSGRYWNAEDFAAFITDFLEDGIADSYGDYSDLGVQPQSPLAMGVTVSGGRCYMGVTVSGMAYKERFELTGATNYAVTANSSGLDRVDAVIARIDVDVAPNASADNIGVVEVLVGSGAVALSDSAIQAAIGSDSFVRLADITVPNGATEVNPVDVADERPKVRIKSTVSLGDYDEDIDGIKTFLQSPLGPSGTPADSLALVTKAYVLSQLASAKIDTDYTSLDGATSGKPISKTAVDDEVEPLIISGLGNPGDEDTFKSGTSVPYDVINIGENKVLGIYGFGTQNYLIVGTVDSDKNTIWDTAHAVLVSSAATTANGRLTRLEDDKAVVIYYDDTNNNLETKVVSITDTTPALGAATVVLAVATTNYFDVAAVDTDKIIACYRDAGDSNKGTSKAATISGTTIGVFGAEEEFETGATSYISVSKAETDKAVVFYRDEGDSNIGKGCILVATGTSVSAATPVDISESASNYFDSDYIEDGKILAVWNDSDGCEARIANIAGLTLSYDGDTLNVADSTSNYCSCAVIDTGIAYCAFEESSTSKGKIKALTISANVVSTDIIASTINDDNTCSYTVIAKLSSKNKTIVLYRDDGDSSLGHSEVYQVYNNVAGIIGFAVSTVATTETVAVRSKGVIDSQTGLTPGEVYYIGEDGLLTIEPTSGVRVGVAKSTTELDIDIDSKIPIAFGGTGVDGPLVISSGTTYLELGRIYNFSSINISGGTLEFTGDDGIALVNCLGNCVIAGTVELRNAISDQFRAITERFNLTTSEGQSFIPSKEGTGGLAASGGAGGDGGDATDPSGTPGVGGAGGILSTVGDPGSGGDGTVGGGGGGGGGGNLGVGTAGQTTINDNGGYGGAGGGGNDGPGGGGGGGGRASGNGGYGGAGAGTGSGNGHGGGGGNGGNSGETGGNGGYGGNGGGSSASAPAVAGGWAGNGGDGYTDGGLGGTGGGGNPSATGGTGGKGIHGVGGQGGAGAVGGAGNAAGDGGAGGDGRTGGLGGAGGNGASVGGKGGRGGNGITGSTAFLLQVGGTMNLNGMTLNAQGGIGGGGGNGPATNGAGGTGGDGGRGADIIMICMGILSGTYTVNNLGGVGGTAGTQSGTGALGVAGNKGADGQLYVNQLTNI